MPIVRTPPTGVERAINARDRWSFNPAMLAIKVLAVETFESGGVFEAYDATQRFGIELDHPNRWGGLLSSAAAQGLIVRAGFTESRRPTRAGGLCRVWRGTEKAVRTFAGVRQ